LPHTQAIIESTLCKRNHSFPYLWAFRTCVLDTGAKVMRYAFPAGDRRSSGGKKLSGDASTADLKDIAIPLTHAVVSVDADACVFTLTVPSGVAKHCEFNFRCANAAELQKWQDALAAVCSSDIPSARAESVSAALQSLQLATPAEQLGTSGSKEVFGSEDSDLASRSLPSKSLVTPKSARARA
jgi:hypothetical protein